MRHALPRLLVLVIAGAALFQTGCSEFIDREVPDAGADVPVIEDALAQDADAADPCGAVVCDDGNPCTDDRCDPSRSGCVFEPREEGTSCDDGAFCTTGDQCNAGVCAGESVTCPDGAGGCLRGVCDELLHSCTTVPAQDDVACDDGDECTTGDRCSDAVCVSTGVVECPDVANACQTNTCTPSTGECATSPVADGASCNDENACTFADACDGGVCVGVTIDCGELTAGCVVGVCDPGSGTCTTGQAPEGTICDDGSPCTVLDSCATGVCVGTPKDCELVLGPCQAGTCDGATGECVGLPKPDNAPCDDGNACTTVDSCSGGECFGAGLVDCSELDDDCMVGVCEPVSGTCATAPAADGSACNDADPCTLSDECTAGTCGGEPIDCSAADGVCTVGVCGDAGQCEPAPAPEKDGTPCSNTNLCVVSGTCDTGECVGIVKDCSALDSDCTVGACVPETGDCESQLAPFGTPCEDDLACTTGEVCDAGACVSFGTVDCSELASACVVAFCSEATGGCTTSLVEDGATCTDGAPCTVGDQCLAGECVGAPKDCSQLDGPCVTGSCVSGSGACVALANEDGLPCDDGVDCTDGDACVAGACQSGPEVDCPCPAPHRAAVLAPGCFAAPEAAYLSAAQGFTVELWLRTTSTTPARLFDARATTAVGEADWSITYSLAGNSAQLRLEYGNVTGTDSTIGMAGITLNDGQWHHIALTRTGVTVRWWVDGVGLFAQNTSNMTSLETAVGMTIGCSRFGGEGFDGEIDGVRISSLNRYIEPFSPPGRHMPDAGTTALWRFDTSTPEVGVPDDSGNGYTLTPSGVVSTTEEVAAAFEATCCGDGVVSFGEQCEAGPGCSATCDGAPPFTRAWTLTSDGCVSLDDPTLVPSPATMTIEFWLQWDGTAGGLLAREAGAQGDYRLDVDASGRLVFVGETEGGPQSIVSFGNVADGQWHHVALMFAAPSFVRWYLDGSPEATQALGSPLPDNLSVAPLELACSEVVAAGRIDSLRISPFVRYTQPFIPTPILAPDNDTELLWSFDQPSLPPVSGVPGVRVIDVSSHARDGLASTAQFTEVVP